MLSEFANKMQGQYTLEDLTTLETIEDILVFQTFNSQIALDLGSLIVQKSQRYPEEVAVMIKREADGVNIFQYVADSKAQRNIDFAMRKRLAVLASGHSSLWPLVHRVVTGEGELVAEALPVGGAFPIKVDGHIVATLAVSGLHEGMDFQIIVDSLREYLQVSIPDFRGQLV